MYSSRSSDMARLIADIFMLVGAFLLPWWLMLVALALCIFFFREYYEGFALGIIIDSLYNAPVPLLYHFQFFLTLLVVILFVIAEYAKRRLTFYR